MATTTRWTTVNGMVLEETVDGTTSLLLPDPQGNVVGKINSSQQVRSKTWYWPYGEVRTGTLGAGLGYGGAWGYFTDTPYGSSRIYVRARYLQQNYGRWMTVDPVWVTERAFRYASNSPASLIDPLGLRPLPANPFLPPFDYPKLPSPPAWPGLASRSCKDWNDFIYTYCNNCARNPLLSPADCDRVCSTLAQWYYGACKDPSRPRPPGEPWWPERPTPGPVVPCPRHLPTKPRPCPRQENCTGEYEKCMDMYDRDRVTVHDPGHQCALAVWVLCGLPLILCQMRNSINGH